MKSLSKKIRGGVLMGVGYMLSPLSWWNDAFFNLPIALVFGYATSWFHSEWFAPATLVGYWLSNVAGMVMMQFGTGDLVFDGDQRNLQRDLWIGFGSSTAYTMVIAVLVYWHILEVPAFLVNGVGD
ncbi:MAG: hypothetical protein AAF892_06955 [Cyanobacteria bacterium P01_D01_bin.71]